MNATPAAPRPAWRDSLRAYLAPASLRMLALGFSAGLPLLLVIGTLSFRLREAGIDRATIGYLSWVGLAYGFKWMWAPLVDRLPLPGLTRWLGRRRAWLLLGQLGVIAGLLGMAVADPRTQLGLLVGCALLAAFASATQDIALDAFRIESAPPDGQPVLAACYQTGYRLAMIWAGAGALWLAGATESAPAAAASAIGACAPAGAAAATPAITAPVAAYDNQGWMWAYAVMAASMLVGVLTLLLGAAEPAASIQASRGSLQQRQQALLAASTRGVPLAGIAAFALWLLLLATVLAAAMQAGWMRTVAGWGPQWLAALGSGATTGRLSGQLAAAAPQAALAALALACTARAVRGAGARWRPPPGTYAAAALAWVQASFISPFADFFGRYGRQALLLLLLIGTYRISDVVMGVMANPFYVDMCFTKAEVAAVTKTWGVAMTLLGAFVGGALALRFGVMRILMLGALLSALSNLLFAWLAGHGHSLPALVLVVSADNLASGLASAAFVGYLSSLTNLSYSATQYALFSSLMLLGPKFLAGFSGDFVNAFGYSAFFTGTALLGLPVLLLIWAAGRTHPALSKKIANSE